VTSYERGALPIAPIVLILMARKWRSVVLGVMVLMVFEGALRKWVFPSLQAQIYFLKDVLFFAAFVGFLLERTKSNVHIRLLNDFRELIILSMVFCFLQIVNPNNPSELVWLIGFKSYFLYMALLFMVPHVFHSTNDLRSKLTWFMFLMLPVAALGMFQFVLPPDNFINHQVSHDVDLETHVSQFGAIARARASGTFSYIGGDATFVQAIFPLALAFLISGGRGKRLNWIALVLLGASALAMFTTGSRTTVLNCALSAVIVLSLTMRVGLINTTTVSRIIIGTGLISAVVVTVGGEALDAFLFRAESAGNASDRLLSPFVETMEAFEVAPIFGTGLGTTHNSAPVIMRAPDRWWLGEHRFEIETARIMQELGIVGFILIYAVRIALIIAAIRMTNRLRFPLFKALSAAIASFFITQFFLFIVNNPTGGLFYWFSAGLLYSMYRLEVLERSNPHGPYIAQMSRHPAMQRF